MKTARSCWQLFGHILASLVLAISAAVIYHPLIAWTRARKFRIPQQALGLAMIGAGVIFVVCSLLATMQAQQSSVKALHTHRALTSNKVVPDEKPVIAGTPIHISIPSVQIDLAVIPGLYNPVDQSWTLSLTSAQYGVMTAKANNKQGDTFIYGHARVGVFYSLPKIEAGAQAIVTTDNGHTFTYTFESSVITTPGDTSLFSYKGKPILVLQTCTGVWYQDRQLFTFNLTAAV